MLVLAFAFGSELVCVVGLVVVSVFRCVLCSWCVLMWIIAGVGVLMVELGLVGGGDAGLGQGRARGWG